MKKRIDINKYIGKWYEIAKIPSAFEPELYNVTAEYTLNNDGTITVVNTGYTDNKEISIDGKISIKGIAKLTNKDDLLMVSFFKGLESEYNILAITEDYQYALVGGESPNYLWILGRKNIIPASIYNYFKEVAIEHAYNIEKLTINKN